MPFKQDQDGHHREQRDGSKCYKNFEPSADASGTNGSGNTSPPPDTQDRKALATTRRRLKDQQKEVTRIVRRLEAIITNHLEGARRIGYPLTPEQVLAIIDALCAEAEGKNRPMAFSDGEVTFYLMDGLYEELLGEPSNIFYSTPVAEGVIRFEPLQRDFWLACLGALRQRLQSLVPG